MARLAAALAGLVSAEGGRRDRDRPDGSIRALSAYLVGFSVLRTGANAYVHLATLGRILTRADSYALAILSTVAACFPLAAGILLSSGRADAERRLALIPVPVWLRLAIAAIGPAVNALPVLALASVLPVMAAAPIAVYSFPDYLKVALWYPAACAASALGFRSLLGAAKRLSGSRRTGTGSRERRIALVIALAVAAIANPRPTVSSGRGALALFGSTTIAAGVSARLSLPLEKPAASILTLACSIVFAATAALAEALASREPAHKPSRMAGFGFRRIWTAPIMLVVVDAERRVFPDLAATSVLAAVCFMQGAAPAVPIWFAAGAFTVRAGAAMAFLATDNDATRRFALIPAKPGTVERSFFTAAVSTAFLVAVPLLAASLGRALRGVS